jgi:hypothetical protein
MKELFVPESLTPLAFTPLYAELSDEDKLAYNHLHGRYFLEQTIFFEQLMGRPALDVIANSAPNEILRNEARDFANEEDAHSSWFRELLREVAPGAYENTDFVLLSAPMALRCLTQWTSRCIRLFPGLLWLQLMAEERALYFGRIYLENEDAIDPRFLQVQRKHLADEPSHIRRDEAFLNWIWPATPPWLRRLNARLIRWAIYELLYLPKRSGWRVVEHWLATRPHLLARTAQFRRAMNDLSKDTAFLASLYPRKFLPRTDLLSKPWPELAFLDKLLTDSPTIL